MPDLISRLVQVHVFRKKTSGIHEYLLLLRSRSDPQYPGMWQVVTGTIDGKESALEAAKREVQEETGLAPLRIEIIPYVASFYNPAADSIELVPVFAFEAHPSSVVRLSEEHEKYQWLSYESAISRLKIQAHKTALEILEKTMLKKE
ncbi:MAG: NUDIX pyrophosphatase [Chlorobi bacterium]|nr:NUDIX pyrophosphatase [Chlorobiota bacterium]